MNGRKLSMQMIFSMLVATAIILFLATNGFAIPASYGSATHDTTRWQELATQNNPEIPDSDFGVWWSTDGGTTWGHEEVSVGDTLQFQFNMHKENVGTHYADHLKVWLDWDQDGNFDETTDIIAYEEQPLLTNESGNLGSGSTPNVADYIFYSGPYTILDEYVGDLWLRARVTCSHSIISNWDNQWSTSYSEYYSLFSATGNLYQGEVEEWRLTVSNNEVPEPATMLLFGTGIAGIAGLRRRQNKKN